MAARALTLRYDGVAQAFHWTVVLLVVLQYATKWLSPGDLPFATKQGLNAWHLGIGPAVLLLMLARLAWRLTHTPPSAPDDIPPALQFVSRGTHWLFYALLVVLPVLGWIAASGFGAGVTLLGLVPLPALVGKDRPLAEAIGSAHGALAWVVLVLIGLHVAGALYHALVKHDGVLSRMLPGGER
ncbi:MAG: cytochrome b [Alphaproteobacteria bacterium]|nr:MAG: cytochrome b [Alphaproteobacteria bacterium]